MDIPENEIRQLLNYYKNNVNDDFSHELFPETLNALEKANKAKNIPYQKIVDLYHEVLPELPACKMLTTKRKGQIKQRHIKDMKDLETWREYFGYVRESSFLMGNVPAYGDRRPFIANLEWLTNESNYCKVYEEKYHG